MFFPNIIKNMANILDQINLACGKQVQDSYQAYTIQDNRVTMSALGFFWNVKSIGSWQEIESNATYTGVYYLHTIWMLIFLCVHSREKKKKNLSSIIRIPELSINGLGSGTQFLSGPIITHTYNRRLWSKKERVWKMQDPRVTCALVVHKLVITC